MKEEKLVRAGTEKTGEALGGLIEQGIDTSLFGIWDHSSVAGTIMPNIDSKPSSKACLLNFLCERWHVILKVLIMTNVIFLWTEGLFLALNQQASQNEKKREGLQRCTGEGKSTSRWEGCISNFQETCQNWVELTVNALLENEWPSKRRHGYSLSNLVYMWPVFITTILMLNRQVWHSLVFLKCLP